jgi:hypothetical protein
VWSVDALRLPHEACLPRPWPNEGERGKDKRGTNVTLRRSLMVCVLALILAAMAAGAAPAAPRTVDPDTLTPTPPRARSANKPATT